MSAIPIQQHNLILEAALRYARHGWRVTPVRGKRAFIDDWHALASNDEAQIRAWWKENPRANVGLVMGAANGLFAVDVDPRHGGDDSLDDCQAKHGPLPDTLQQITPTGGRHILFRHPGFEVPTRVAVLPGIDIRGDNNGQIVAEPSIHPDVQKPYAWDGLAEFEQQPIADAPAWLLDLVRRPEPKPAAAIPEKIPHGTQHDYLVSMAGTLRRRGMDAEIIELTLWAINTTRCEKPGPRKHIQQIAKDICNYPPGREFQATGKPTIQPKPKPKLEDFDGEAIYEANFPEQLFIIDGLLPLGLTILPGRPKVGKSWLALQLAIAVATGQRFCGQLRVNQPGRVAYLGLEEPQRRTSSRMKKLYRGDSYLLQNIRFLYKIAPLFSGGLQMLDEYLTENPVKLCLIDTFLAFAGNSGGSTDVLRSEYAEMNALRELADRHKIAPVVVHHTRKMGGDAIDTVSGTTGITAGFVQAP